MASTMIFLKLVIDGKTIDGESTAAGKFRGQIEVESFSWGVEAVLNEKTSAGKARSAMQFDNLSISKFFDKSSVNLCHYMSRRQQFSLAHLTFASLVVGEAGEEPVPVMEIKLGKGYIEDVRLSASEGGRSIAVREDVKLSFQEAELTYYPMQNYQRDQRGSGGAPCTYRPAAVLQAG